MGGQAIAEAIFGVVPPSGRLPYSILTDESVKSMKPMRLDMRPNASEGYSGRTYRFYTGTAVVPFGYGLSYSSFSYEVVGSPPSLSLASLDALLRSAHAKTGTHFPKLADGAQSAALWRLSAEMDAKHIGSHDL